MENSREDNRKAEGEIEEKSLIKESEQTTTGFTIPLSEDNQSGEKTFLDGSLPEKTEKKEQSKPAFIGPTRPRVEELTKIKQLGSGNFSKIYLVEEYRTRRLFAMKEYLKFDAERRKKTQDLVMEKYVLNKLKGLKRTVDLHETFKDESSVYFNMEYLPGGELWNLIYPFGLFSKAEIKYYFLKIVLAVEEIHSRGIIHRDLKPENIMLNQELTDLKLVDFATSWDFHNPEMKGSGNGSTGRRIYYHFVGTPQYMPVEFIRNKGSFVQSDVYSLGCILYQLICGFPPFIGPGEYQIFQKTDAGKIDFYDFFTDQEKDLIISMTKKNYEERIMIEDIKKHPYFQDNYDFYHNTSSSLKEILDHRTKQEQWLVDIKDKVMNKLRNFDNEEEKEREASKGKVEEKNDEPKKEGEEEPLPENHPDNKPPVFKKEEKGQMIKEEIEKAASEIPEGENSVEIMKSRLKHLRKQLQHKAKVKNFEHYC